MVDCNVAGDLDRCAAAGFSPKPSSSCEPFSVNIDTFWGLSATAWTAIASLLTGGLLLVAVVAALYAGRQVRIAREQGEESRAARAEASRPYVIVTIESSRTGPPLFDLVVRNIGQRPAVNVSITLDPPPVRASEAGGYELSKIKMLNEPIAMVAPDQEMRTFYDNQGERHGRTTCPPRTRSRSPTRIHQVTPTPRAACWTSML